MFIKKKGICLIVSALMLVLGTTPVYAKSTDSIKPQLDTSSNVTDTLKSCATLDAGVVNKGQKVLSNVSDKSLSETGSIKITKSALNNQVTKNIQSDMNLAASVVDQNNHDPNSAIYWGTYSGGITGKVATQGITTQAGQSDWYAFTLAQGQKITTKITYSGSSAQYVVVLYQLSGTTLNPVVSGSNETVYNAAAGTYYLRVVATSGYDNVNSFTLENYGSNGDQYEIDDSVSSLSANSIKSGDFTQVGNIDNPYDTDIIQYSPRTNVSVLLHLSVPSGAPYSVGFYKLNKTTGSIDYIGTIGASQSVTRLTGMEAGGTYYFVVTSANGYFNTSNNYSLQIETQIPAQVSGSVTGGDTGYTSTGAQYVNSSFQVTGTVVDQYGYAVQNISVAALLGFDGVSFTPCNAFGDPSNANGSFVTSYYCNGFGTGIYALELRCYNPLVPSAYVESIIGNINVYHPQ